MKKIGKKVKPVKNPKRIVIPIKVPPVFVPKPVTVPQRQPVEIPLGEPERKAA